MPASATPTSGVARHGEVWAASWGRDKLADMAGDGERAGGTCSPGAPGNVFYFVHDLAEATRWYATVAQWSAHGASAHRGPKTIMTGERLCQMLDPFGNLFGLCQPPA
jgi:predicted enzyme related to lactoylglutathione lyase